MQIGFRLAVITVVMCLFTGGCASYRYSADVSESRDCMTIRESVIKADAAAMGYKMEADRMVAFAERVLAGLPVATVDCRRDFIGVEFCAIHTPSEPRSWETQMHALEIDFRVVYPGDVFEARALCRTRPDMIYHRHSYVIDGMQIVRIYTWYEAPDTYMAVVFEPTDTE